MPPVRQPLRDRCNVYLRVCTDNVPTSMKSKLPANLVSSAGNTPPATSIAEDRLSRMKSPPPLPTGIRSPYVIVDTPSDEIRPRQFIPYLYLSSESPPSPSAALPQGNWTHAIRILPASKDHPAGSTSITGTAGSPQVLELYVPAVAPNSRSLPLHKRHILVARDFLALALPYYASAHPVDDSPDSEFLESDSEPFLLSSASSQRAPPPTQRCRTDAVRVLLMGPARAILAVAFTYIAYASECTVAHVMRCVVEEGEDQESCELLGADAQMGLRAREMQVLELLAQKGL
ncbi:hypothetical protein K438DRAFT_1994704 [Mycena galopus ATCC 62051]|nr:hypothetical protein K438DRAFT_1994704 [Mycena galopus ATCC 62051]